MAKKKLIELTKLVVDTDNPRIADILENQNDVIRAIASQQNRKIVNLATDIQENGLNPAESILVMPYHGNNNLFVVLEGNRRVVALKLLENPELIKGNEDKTTYNLIKSLSKKYLENPITVLDCVIVESRDESHHWINLKHTGQNEGAGVVPWGASEKERFRRRSGQKSPRAQVLDFLEERNYIDKSTRQKTPVSSLERLISTPHVRNKLGIEIKDGHVSTKFSEDEVAKGLKRIVLDLATQQIRTGDIYHSKDRIEYIDSLSPSDLPDPSKESEELKLIEETSIDQSSKSPKKTTPRSKPSQRKRSTLIPTYKFALSISQARINDIYHELRSLKIEDFPNAISVLFRVFLELSLDYYIENNNISTGKDTKLNSKINIVGDHLKSLGKLNNEQLKPVRKVAQSGSFLGTTITTMHQYVHNENFYPAPGDLISGWDNLQIMFQAIWE